MAHIWIAVHQLLIERLPAIVKVVSHRMPWVVVQLITVPNFCMLLVAMRAQQQMASCITLHELRIYVCHRTNTTWQMQDLVLVMPFWFLIEGHDITLQNGAVQVFGMISYYPHKCSANYASPTTKEELFNLHHASARNTVECIFGIIKKRWTILSNAPEFSMELQAHLLPALAALHNFIVENDPADWQTFAEVQTDPHPGIPHASHEHGALAAAVPTEAEKRRANHRRDEIAQKMWDDYQALLREQGDIQE